MVQVSVLVERVNHHDMNVTKRLQLIKGEIST